MTVANKEHTNTHVEEKKAKQGRKSVTNRKSHIKRQQRVWGNDWGGMQKEKLKAIINAREGKVFSVSIRSGNPQKNRAAW